MIKLRPARRIAAALQAVLLLGLPFLRIGGESALRFDIPSLELYFFGARVWMDEFFIVLAALIFLTFLIAFVTLFFGRVWCGWLCPQTVLSDFTSFLDRRRGPVAKAAGAVAALALSIVVAASLVWYFVSPYEFFSRLFAGNLGSVISGFWGVLTAIIALDLVFVRRRFCASVCPYAKMQSALFDRKTLVIAYDSRRENECMHCSACALACPVKVDIRKGLNAACISCGECIDACARMRVKVKRDSLVGYFFGFPGEQGTLFRSNLMIVGTATAASLLFFMYLSLTRLSVDMTVLPDPAIQSRLTAEGKTVQTFVLSAENRSTKQKMFSLGARFEKREEGTLEVLPRAIALGPQERKKVAFTVVLSGSPQPGSLVPLRLEAREDAGGMVVTKKIYLRIPNGGSRTT